MAVSLISLVLAVAYEVDDIQPYSILLATSTTVRGSGLGNLTSNASTGSYNGAWAYANDQQRRVRTDGYAPSVSELTINAPWDATPSIGDTLYVTRRTPIRASGAPDEATPYQVHVQNALRHLAYPDIVTLAITTGDTYSLSTYQSWLDRQERLVGIREPSPVSGRDPVEADWRRPTIRRQGTTVYLRLGAPFETGASGALTLDVLRPAHSLVSGGESTTGPTEDAHTVEANPDDVKCGALAFLYYALARKAMSSPDGTDWANAYIRQRAEFEGLQFFDRSRRLPRLPGESREAA